MGRRVESVDREDGRESKKRERKNLGEELRRNRGWASNIREFFPFRKGVFWCGCGGECVGEYRNRKRRNVDRRESWVKVEERYKK